MVALNWQRWDKGMMLNEGMFSGEQGWVLKPEGYRETDLDTPKISRQTLDMTIKLLAGQDLPVPEGERHSKKFRPYVKIALHVGQPEEISKAVTEKDKGDSASFKRKSNTLAGIEPDFEGEALQFAGIQNVIEDLAFVRQVLLIFGLCDHFFMHSLFRPLALYLDAIILVGVLSLNLTMVGVGDHAESCLSIPFVPCRLC